MPKRAKTASVLTDDQISTAQIAAQYLNGVFGSDAKVSDWLRARGFPLSKGAIGELRRGSGKLSISLHEAIVHWANVHQSEEQDAKKTGTPFSEPPKPLITHGGVLKHVERAVSHLRTAEQEITLASEQAGLPITTAGFMKLVDQLATVRKTYLETILGKAQ